MSSTDTTTKTGVAVVLQNLPPAETLNQMVDNLNYLCRVFDDAFNAIETQVNNERKKIISIQERVLKANEQTEMIAKYPNKSTTIHSHCEFPNINQDIPNKHNIHLNIPLINMTNKLNEIKRNKYNLTLSQRLKKAQNVDTLSLYSKISENTKSKNTEKIEGLGTLPKWIDSIGNTLLFNTDQNPYMKYSTTDNLFGKDQKARDKEEKELFAAPKTITDRKNLNMDEVYDIGYQPELENVPIFNAPQQLTALSGLGNLALDLKWGSTNQHKIAPTAVNFQDLPELEQLPDFDDIIPDEFGFGDYGTSNTPGNNNITSGNSNNNFNNNGPPAPPQPNNNGPPAPPAPPKPVQPSQNNIPQPPAPPPKPAPQPKPAAAAPIKKKSGGGRANLLASIRAGKKLKKAAKGGGAPGKKGKAGKGKKLPPKPMSMMDHLKMKLQARNKIMRGKTSNNNDNRNEMAPPKLDDDDMKINKKPSDIMKLRKTNRNKPKKDTDKTGLGLANLPDHMRKSMLIMDDSDDDQLSSASWDDQ